MIENLNAEDDQVLMWTIGALAGFGHEANAAVPVLSKLAKQEATARDSIRALGEMGSDAVPPLLDVFRNGEGFSRAFAARALAKIGPETHQRAPRHVGGSR